MVDRPKRIQLSRKKGWRMPKNTASVARPGKFGNPFSIINAIDSGFATRSTAQSFVVECFRDWIGPTQSGRDWWQGPESDKRKAAIIEGIADLRGKNLACWCSLPEMGEEDECHGAVLLEIANG